MPDTQTTDGPQTENEERPRCLCPAQGDRWTGLRVNAYLQNAKYLLPRGLDGARGEWLLLSACHNCRCVNFTTTSESMASQPSKPPERDESCPRSRYPDRWGNQGNRYDHNGRQDPHHIEQPSNQPGATQAEKRSPGPPKPIPTHAPGGRQTATAVVSGPRRSQHYYPTVRKISMHH